MIDSLEAPTYYDNLSTMIKILSLKFSEKNDQHIQEAINKVFSFIKFLQQPEQIKQVEIFYQKFSEIMKYHFFVRQNHPLLPKM